MSNTKVKSNLFNFNNRQEKLFTLDDVYKAEKDLVLELYRFAMRGTPSNGVKYESELFVRVLNYSTMTMKQLSSDTKKYSLPVTKYGALIVTLGHVVCMTQENTRGTGLSRIIVVPTTLLDQLLDYNAIVCEYLSQQDYIDGLNKGNYWKLNSTRFNRSVPKQKTNNILPQFYTPKTIYRKKSKSEYQDPEDDYRNYKHWVDSRPEMEKDRPRTANKESDSTKTFYVDSKYLTDFLNDGVSVDTKDSVSTNVDTKTNVNLKTNRKICFEEYDIDSETESDYSDYTDINDPHQ